MASLKSACPACGVNGHPVKELTLTSLLNSEAKTRVKSGRKWRFCTTKSCNTAYYADISEEIFVKNDLVVRIGIKESDAPRHVCYCFDHTIEEIEEQIRKTGKTEVLDDIKKRMQKACWCETKSPMGSCCLATVTKYVKAAEKNSEWSFRQRSQ